MMCYYLNVHFQDQRVNAEESWVTNGQVGGAGPRDGLSAAMERKISADVGNRTNSPVVQPTA